MSGISIVGYSNIDGLAMSVLINNGTLGIGGDAVGRNGGDGLLALFCNINNNSVEGDGLQSLRIGGVAILVNPSRPFVVSLVLSVILKMYV